jgi:arylsulfatase A-like enzyme
VTREPSVPRTATTLGCCASAGAGLGVGLALFDGALAGLRGAGLGGGLLAFGAAAALLVPPALVLGLVVGALLARGIGPPALPVRLGALWSAGPGDAASRRIVSGLVAVAVFVTLHRAVIGALDEVVRSVVFRALVAVLTAFGAGAVAVLASGILAGRARPRGPRPRTVVLGVVGLLLGLGLSPILLAPAFAEALGLEFFLAPLAAALGAGGAGIVGARRGARLPVALAVVCAALGAALLVVPEARATVAWSTVSARRVLPLLPGGARGGPLGVPAEPRPPFMAPAAPRSVVARRPVVLISLDAVGADHLELYGFDRPTAPRLTEWARGAVVFRAAMAPGPVTRLSMPAFFVGLHPSQVAMTRRTGATNEQRLADTTLAERLRAGGYRTVAVPGGRYFVGFRGLTQGFEVVDRTAANETRRLETRGAIVTARARLALDEARALEGPTFLWIHYDDAHAPHSAIPGAPRFGRREVDRYDQEIWWIDRQLAELFPAIERALGDRDPLVLVTADHGERFSPGGRAIDRAQALEPGTLWVPLLAKMRGLAPHRVRGAVSLLDLPPTILDLVGLAPRGVRFEGRSLVPELLGRRDDRGRVVWAELDQAGPRVLDAVAARRGDRLLLLDRLRGAGRSFDLGRDPRGTRPSAHVPGELAAQVEAHVARVGADFARWSTKTRARGPRRAKLGGVGTGGLGAGTGLR